VPTAWLILDVSANMPSGIQPLTLAPKLEMAVIKL
jgi:hypothetical protein